MAVRAPRGPKTDGGGSAAAAETPIAVVPIGAGSWSDLETLFGRNGACGGCWCMHWRVLESGPRWQAIKGAPNRRRFGDLVRSGAAEGVLAFAAGHPVGWCALGRYQDFPRLARARTLTRACRPEDGRRTWSIVCFVVARGWRRRGIAGLLLAGAVKRAFALGATEIEAYPVLPQRMESVPDVFAFTGVPSLFERAGFVRLDPNPMRRSIYLLRRGGRG
jgi:GNAT superfamily N-acetyltransferase